MRIKLSILFTLLLISTQGFGQSSFILKGVVKDANTQEIMPFATVFFAGTTFGTTTNDKGQYAITVNQSGTYDLVVKFLGYETYAAQVRLGSAEVSKLDISLTPGARDLGSVVVVAKKNASWKRYLQDFESVFLGQSINGINTKILNSEVLDFVYDEETSQLSAFSTEPMIIENKELGYKIKYYLEQFVLDYPSEISGFYGYTVFEEIEPKNDRKARNLEKNRAKAYNGSAAHFFKSLYANKLQEEGFVVQLSNKAEDDGSLAEDKDVALYDRLKISPDSEYKQLTFDSYLNITYMNEKESMRYASATASQPAAGLTITSDRGGNNYQLSQILLLDGYSSIEFEASGFIRNPTSFYSLGYWGFEKVADLVPLDYSPASKD